MYYYVVVVVVGFLVVVVVVVGLVLVAVVVVVVVYCDRRRSGPGQPRAAPRPGAGAGGIIVCQLYNILSILYISVHSTLMAY